MTCRCPHLLLCPFSTHLDISLHKSKAGGPPTDADLHGQDQVLSLCAPTAPNPQGARSRAVEPGVLTRMELFCV